MELNFRRSLVLHKMEGSSCVAGEWKNFVFKMIEPEDEQRVLENLLHVFCKDEPIKKAMKAYESSDFLDDFSSFAALILKKNETDRLSFLALDKTTSEVAGVMVTYIERPDNPEEAPLDFKSKIIGDIRANVLGLDESINIYERYGIQEYAELIFTSVDPKYRGQGLATEIYRRSFDLLRSRGIPLCKSTFTSPFMQKVVIKYGFEELARKYFRDFVGKDGQQLMPNAKEDEVAIVMALKF